MGTDGILYKVKREKTKALNLYERVAERLTDLIARGVLRPGHRLPSIRQMAQQEQVSINTILQGYALLEEQGLIRAIPRSGYVVAAPRLPQREEPRAGIVVDAPVTVQISTRIAQFYQSMREPSAAFGAATLSTDLLPYERLNQLMGSVARSAGQFALTYDALPGYFALRRQIARRSVESGCDISPEEILITIGAIEAIHLCLRAVTQPGDMVVVESPTYFGILQLVERAGLRAVEVPLRPDGMDLEILAQVIAQYPIKACLSIPNFSNPGGTLMPPEAKAQLVALLAGREIPLIESDVYGDLYFDAVRPRPAKSFDTNGLVLYCSSFSKTLAPGYRVGWVAAGRYQADVEQWKFSTTVATPVIPQMVLAEFLTGGGYDRFLRPLRKRLEMQVEQYAGAISEAFPPGTRLSRPRGGFLLWVEMPTHLNSDRLQILALQQGISIAPGGMFSASGSGYPSCFRLNCGYPWTEATAKSIQTLAAIIQRL